VVSPGCERLVRLDSSTTNQHLHGHRIVSAVGCLRPPRPEIRRCQGDSCCCCLAWMKASPC